MTNQALNVEKIKEALPNIKLLFNEPLANVTFTKTGGPADVMVFPTNKAEVQAVVKFCQAENYPWQVLGNASNLIVRDGGIRGFVLLLSEMNQVIIEKERIMAEAGAKLIDVAEDALTASLTGMEFACGIPGSIGGAIFMNAGAYEGEIADVLESCEVLLQNGEFAVLTNGELDFRYRHSLLQENGAVLLNGTFRLAAGELSEIAKKMAQLTELRESKQPLEYPSCGSVFKRPEGYFTGKLIQDANLQGFQIGGAQVSEKHAGFIVNKGGATATDYIQLIEHIQAVVWQQFEVRLEPEVRLIGEE